MARTPIPPQTTSHKSALDATLTPVLAVNGGKVENSNQRGRLIAKNTTGSPINFTPTLGHTVDGFSASATAIPIPANKTVYFNAFPDEYNQLSGADKNYMHFEVAADGLSFAWLDA